MVVVVMVMVVVVMVMVMVMVVVMVTERVMIVKSCDDHCHNHDGGDCN